MTRLGFLAPFVGRYQLPVEPPPVPHDPVDARGGWIVHQVLTLSALDGALAQLAAPTDRLAPLGLKGNTIRPAMNLILDANGDIDVASTGVLGRWCQAVRDYNELHTAELYAGIRHLPGGQFLPTVVRNTLPAHATYTTTGATTGIAAGQFGVHSCYNQAFTHTHPVGLGRQDSHSHAIGDPNDLMLAWQAKWLEQLVDFAGYWPELVFFHLPTLAPLLYAEVFNGTEVRPNNVAYTQEHFVAANEAWIDLAASILPGWAYTTIGVTGTGPTTNVFSGPDIIRRWSARMALRFGDADTPATDLCAAGGRGWVSVNGWNENSIFGPPTDQTAAGEPGKQANFDDAGAGNCGGFLQPIATSPDLLTIDGAVYDDWMRGPDAGPTPQRRMLQSAADKTRFKGYELYLFQLQNVSPYAATLAGIDTMVAQLATLWTDEDDGTPPDPDPPPPTGSMVLSLLGEIESTTFGLANTLAVTVPAEVTKAKITLLTRGGGAPPAAPTLAKSGATFTLVESTPVGTVSSIHTWTVTGLTTGTITISHPANVGACIGAAIGATNPGAFGGTGTNAGTGTTSGTSGSPDPVATTGVVIGAVGATAGEAMVLEDGWIPLSHTSVTGTYALQLRIGWRPAADQDAEMGASGWTWAAYGGTIVNIAGTVVEPDPDPDPDPEPEPPDFPAIPSGVPLSMVAKYDTSVTVAGHGTFPVQFRIPNAAGPFPLLLCGHGAEGTGDMINNFMSFLGPQGYIQCGPSMGNIVGNLPRGVAIMKACINLAFTLNETVGNPLYGKVFRAASELAADEVVLYTGTSMGGMIGYRTFHASEHEPRIKAFFMRATMAASGYSWATQPTPVYHVHGTADTTISISSGRSAYNNCVGRKGMVEVNGMNHALSPYDTNLMNDMAMLFFRRFGYNTDHAAFVTAMQAEVNSTTADSAYNHAWGT